jgi:uncharacterized protein (TIGR03435 family)
MNNAAGSLHAKRLPRQRLRSNDGIGGAPSSEPGEGSSLFTAIEEQLGLKLQASRGPDEVLVIDQAEKPGQ